MKEEWKTIAKKRAKEINLMEKIFTASYNSEKFTFKKTPYNTENQHVMMPLASNWFRHCTIK